MNKRELLMDFMGSISTNDFETKDACEIVDDYLSSINYSNESDEFRTIGNNENTQENFTTQYCKCPFPDKNTTSCYCGKCGGYVQ